MVNETQGPKILHGIKEISQFYGKSNVTISKLIKSEGFPAYREGPSGVWVSRSDWVLEWMDAKRQGAKIDDLEAIQKKAVAAGKKKQSAGNTMVLSKDDQGEKPAGAQGDKPKETKSEKGKSANKTGKQK